MPKIILLCGLPGSGKTTIARGLVERIDKIALMEGDALIMIKPWKDDEHLSTLKLSHGVAILKNFLKAGYEHIVFPGFIWNQTELDKLLAAFPENQNDFYVFWLSANQAMRYERRVDRAQVYDEPDEEPNPEYEKLHGFSLPSGKSYEILTEDKTPQEVAQEILEKLL